MMRVNTFLLEYMQLNWKTKQLQSDLPGVGLSVGLFEGTYAGQKDLDSSHC